MSCVSRLFVIFLAMTLVMTLASDVVAQQPNQNDEQLRRRVINAIERGQQFLIESQNANGSWPAGGNAGFPEGVNGLVTLALLNSGLPANQPNVSKALDFLEHPQTDPATTYAISLVLMALAAGDRNAAKIAKMASKLENSQRTGADGGNWHYSAGSASYDNSNTQFAVLALREAAHAGIPIDREVWKRSQDHFLRAQIGSRQANGSAGWAYTAEGSPYGSMTVAGLASMIITQEMLQDDKDVGPNGQLNCCGNEVDDVQRSIDAGIRWLDRHLRVESNPEHQGRTLYYLYGLERAGRFSGQRFFGERDWYREGAEFLVRQQNPRNGSWSIEDGGVVSTSLALLFLSKGLSPVLINKLKYDQPGPKDDDLPEEWNRHPRDIKNLTNFIAQQDKWPKLLSWQVVDLQKASENEGVAALLQSPVQYLSGSSGLDAIQGRELELLRKYLAQGGFIFAVNNCETDEFDTSFRDLVRRLFDGQSRLEKLPATHDVYRSEFIFKEGAHPELWGVDFGCRTAIIYSPYDHACRWSKWTLTDSPNRNPAVKTQVAKSLSIGTNVIAYATGRELWDKLEPPKVLSAGELNQLSRGRLTIARLRHKGGWDTAPNALGRLQASLETVGIEAARETPNLPANDPAMFDYPLIYMHGRRHFQLTDEEIAGLQAYLENGGFLFADACCGAEQFDESFRQFIEQMFGEPLKKIPTTHQIYKMDVGYDIRSVKRRIPREGPNASSLETRESVGPPILEGIEVNGKYVVVYSRYDLSCALERQATTACAGYATADAAKIGVNFVLYGLFQ